MTLQPVLKIENLSVHRSGFKILDHISWQTYHGEDWVILGANGSGKTSLLQALMGYLTPTTGSITILGETFGHTDWRELRKFVGIVSSSVAHLISLEDTGLEIVAGGKSAIIGSWKQISKAERSRALELLESVEAGHLASKNWGIFSQGERQRVLIARALMAAPKILILDESCAGLDPVARENFLAFLAHHGPSTTRPPLLFVTHHVEEIIPRFTHSLVLKGGCVIAACPLSELNSHTLSEAFSRKVILQRQKQRFKLTVS